MSVIWYAIGIYMVGIAVILYVRTRIMFREDGVWKEFGLATQADLQTIFPFWMFALVWAILSYALANLLSMFFASIALRSADTPAYAPPNASFIQPISENPAVNVAPLPPKVPGYYIMDPYSNPAQPRYLYYGTEPPTSFRG